MKFDENRKLMKIHENPIDLSNWLKFDAYISGIPMIILVILASNWLLQDLGFRDLPPNSLMAIPKIRCFTVLKDGMRYLYFQNMAKHFGIS